MPHHTQRDLYFAYHCLCIVILFWNPDRRRRGGHWSQFYPGKYHTHLPVKFSVGDTSVCFGNELKLNAIVSHTCLLFPGWHLAHCIKPLLWGSGQSLLLSVPTNISLLCLGFLNLLIYCVIMWLGTHEEVRGQLGWDRSLLPSCWSWDSNSGIQVTSALMMRAFSHGAISLPSSVCSSYPVTVAADGSCCMRSGCSLTFWSELSVMYCVPQGHW